MKAVWVDARQDPAYEKYGPHGITVPVFEGLESRITADYLDGVRAHPGIEQCALVFAWNWLPEGTSPQRLAEAADATLRRIGWQGNAWVWFDIEKGHGLTDVTFVPYVVACLRRWRELRPTRPTWLTVEGMQGPLFSPGDVLKIASWNVTLAPQFYRGDMTPLPHSPVIDLLIAGFPGARIDGMYNAADLPYNWRGCAFTQGAL